VIVDFVAIIILKRRLNLVEFISLFHSLLEGKKHSPKQLRMQNLSKHFIMNNFPMKKGCESWCGSVWVREGSGKTLLLPFSISRGLIRKRERDFYQGLE